MKLLFKIEGIRPIEMPGADLAKFMMELASLLGPREAIHFTAIKDASVGVEIDVPLRRTQVVRARMKAAGRGEIPELDARLATINGMLAKQKKIATIWEHKKEDQPVVRLQFRGAEVVKGPLPTARDRVTVQGLLIRLEGRDETVHAGISGAEGIFTAQITPDQAKAIRGSFREPVIVDGDATLTRSAEGVWEVGTIIATSIEPFVDVPLSHTLDEMAQLGGFGWVEAGATMQDVMRLWRDE